MILPFSAYNLNFGKSQLFYVCLIFYFYFFIPGSALLVPKTLYKKINILKILSFGNSLSLKKWRSRFFRLILFFYYYTWNIKLILKLLKFSNKSMAISYCVFFFFQLRLYLYNTITISNIFFLGFFFYFSFHFGEINCLIDFLILLLVRLPIFKYLTFLVSIRLFLIKISKTSWFTKNLRGIFIKFKGKLGIRGNLRKRSLFILVGKFSRFNSQNNFLFSEKPVITKSGIFIIQLLLNKC